MEMQNCMTLLAVAKGLAEAGAPNEFFLREAAERAGAAIARLKTRENVITQISADALDV